MSWNEATQSIHEAHVQNSAVESEGSGFDLRFISYYFFFNHGQVT